MTVVDFFQEQFVEEAVEDRLDLMENIPTIINQAENDLMIVEPTTEELREVIFELNGDSSSGLHGFF